MSYKNFTTEDFVQDKKFRQWVLHPDKVSNTFWYNFLSDNPGRLEAIKQAKAIVLSIEFPEHDLAEEDITHMWNHIEEVNQTAGQTGQDSVFPLHPIEMVEHQVGHQPRYGRKFYMAAASVVLLALSVFGYLYFQAEKQYIRYETAFGETQTVLLPDSSIVTLNANSTLTLAADWGLQQTREVWLEGEAFFEVHKYTHYGENTQSADFRSKLAKAGNSLPAAVKFVVHAGEVNVEVLGTAFNVNTRRGSTKVVLNSGKIQLNIKDDKLSENILMEPGEMVAYTQANRQLQKKMVVPETFSSWRNNELVFDKVALGEIARILEDTYGLEVVFEDSTMKQRQFIGSLPADNLDMLLTAFSKMYNISWEGKKVTFHKAH